MAFTLGIDISKWQGEMNWPKAKQAGAKFAFIRAGSINKVTGNCYKDYQLERNAELAYEQMDGRIGFYFYFRPKFDPNKQADYFWGLVRDYNWGALVVDCEAAGATYATMRRNTEKMTEQIASVCGDRKDDIYTRASYWNSVIDYQSWAGKHDLWIARYHPLLSHPWGDGHCKPLGWNDWVFWQFSADGNGLGSEYGGKSKSMDLNRFNGTETELNKYFNVKSDPDGHTLILSDEERAVLLKIAERLR